MSNFILFLAMLACIITLTTFAAEDICTSKGMVMAKIGKNEIACVQK